MPRRPTLAEHLTSDQLEHLCQSCQDPIEARRWQLIWLVAQFNNLKQAAQRVGYSYDYAKEVLQRYNQQGPTGLKNGRKERIQHGGRPALLNAQQQKALKQALATHPPDGGTWTATKVAQWIAQQIGREVRPQRGWDYLQRLKPDAAKA